MTSSPLNIVLFSLVCIGAAPAFVIANGDTNGIFDFSLSSILCRSSQDLLAPSNLTINEGDLSCVASAQRCVTQQVLSCTQQGLTNGSLDTTGCVLQGKVLDGARGLCISPSTLGNCNLTGCSTCSTQHNMAFDNTCISSGGLLCEYRTVLFSHRVRTASVCAPAVCDIHVLRNSLANAYNDVTSHAQLYDLNLGTDKNTSGADITDVNSISCHSYATVRPSTATTDSGSRSSESASYLAVLVALFFLGAAQRFF